jgi:L-ribulose-5-phosphate 4-epimerase
MADSTEQALRQVLADTCRVLFRLGLTDYMGHPSVRLPGTNSILIKPQHSVRHRSQDRLTPEDMVVVDLDGNPVGSGDRPPSERFIHTCIYRARPDVQAIVHTHQHWATIMGIGEAPIEPILHVQGELVADGVPIWPCAKLVTDNTLGEDMAKALGSHRALHLQGHGIVTVAAELPVAAIDAIHLEQLAKANWRVLAMGRKARVIPKDELTQRMATGVGWEVRWAYYRQLAGLDA